MNYGTQAGALLAVSTAGWGVSTIGATDIGWEMLIEIPEHSGERAEMREAVFDTPGEDREAFDTLPSGWYVLVQSYTGGLSVIRRGTEAEAREEYARFEAIYKRWLDARGGK